VTGLRLYNTRTRRKEELDFSGRSATNPITMYVCGPTVYSRAHIGNARPAVVFDVLARLLRHLYGVDALVYARNITDIDDKIMAAAAREGVSTDEIAARFERHYGEDMAALGVAPPDLQPHATHHVPGMIALIETLIARGVAYVAEEHVLFSVAADPDYGSLSGRDRAAMLAGARVDVAPYKRDGADFVLWKPSLDVQPGWDSPWGRGRPGWHIECSAMIRELLGETIDIHGGGQDLIFPHHENEAAQSRCASGGAELARVWMHNGFLSMGADKMSKSAGNVVSVGELLKAGWDGEVIRLTLLSAHYRQPLEWTEDKMVYHTNELNSLYRSIQPFEEIETRSYDAPTLLIDSMADDLNIPKTMSVLYQLRDDLSKTTFDRKILIRDQMLLAGALIGILQHKPSGFLKRDRSPQELLALQDAIMVRLPDFYDRLVINPESFDPLKLANVESAIVEALIKMRSGARERKEYEKADDIRVRLERAGILLEDRTDGTTVWRRA